jgi:8-hydroxy-5-deazaflavin:NADPH oxidoreductase
MAQLGIIGRGRLGRALGVALTRCGHSVAFADSSGGHAAAVESAEVVILAVPYWTIADAIPACGDLTGKIVWSCVNALKPDLSGLAAGFDTSAGEQVAALALRARVVSALPPFAHAIAGAALDYDGRRASTFLCADDTGAKRIVGQLVAEIGAEPIDAGPLASSRLVEPAMMLVVRLAYAAGPPRDLAMALLERPTRSASDDR